MPKKFGLCFLLCNLLHVGCGYRLEGKDSPSIVVPYVQGDNDGALTDELVRQLAICSAYKIGGTDSQYRLEVKILEDRCDVIGYEYDHQDEKLYNRLVSNEERRSIEVELVLIEQATGKVVRGPEKVVAEADYDFVDPESLPDVLVMPTMQSTLSFSLGQLDSVEGARAGALASLYRKLAQKIATGL